MVVVPLRAQGQHDGQSWHQQHNTNVAEVSHICGDDRPFFVLVARWHDDDDESCRSLARWRVYTSAWSSLVISRLMLSAGVEVLDITHRGMCIDRSGESTLIARIVGWNLVQRVTHVIGLSALHGRTSCLNLVVLMPGVTRSCLAICYTDGYSCMTKSLFYIKYVLFCITYWRWCYSLYSKKKKNA